jgi:pilus assembly protein CpaE
VFRKQNPGTGIVLVASSLDPHMMLEAMRAGVTECLQEPVTPQALDQAVRRVLVDALPEQLGRVVAFVGAKGGVGTTTLAVNTAATLARVGAGEALLIDLHTGSGDASLFLGVEPRFTVVDVLENVHRLDDAFFRGVVEKTKVGAEFLGSSDRVSQSAADPQRIRALLESIGKLPVVSGPVGIAREIATQYGYFLRSLGEIGRVPVLVQVSERRAWRLRLDCGLVIELGR